MLTVLAGLAEFERDLAWQKRTLVLCLIDGFGVIRPFCWHDEW
jgi:hypothetical protein